MRAGLRCRRRDLVSALSDSVPQATALWPRGPTCYGGWTSRRTHCTGPVQDRPNHFVFKNLTNGAPIRRLAGSIGPGDTASVSADPLRDEMMADFFDLLGSGCLGHGGRAGDRRRDGSPASSKAGRSGRRFRCRRGCTPPGRGLTRGASRGGRRHLRVRRGPSGRTVSAKNSDPSPSWSTTPASPVRPT